MPPTTLDITAAVSVAANVGLFIVGGLSLYLAYTQINSWKKIKEHDRIISNTDEVFDILTKMKEEYINMLIYKYSARDSQSQSTASIYTNCSQAIARLRPQTTRLKLLALKESCLDHADDITMIVNDALLLWESQRKEYSKHYIHSDIMREYCSQPLANKAKDLSRQAELMAGVIRTPEPPEEEYYPRACNNAVVTQMDDLISRTAAIISRHLKGEI